MPGAFVQTKDSGALQTATGGVAVTSAAFSASITAHNFLWAALTHATGATINAITLGGQTASLAVSLPDTESSQVLSLYYVLDATGGTTASGSVTFAADTVFVQLIVVESSGVATASAADGAGSVFVHNTTATTGNFSPTPSVDGDYIISALMSTGGEMTAMGDPTATNTTLVKRVTTAGPAISVADGTQTTAATTTVTWGWTTGSNAVLLGAAFKTGAASTTEQEGFRARNDNGGETDATWIATQDANFTGPLDSNTRIRFSINAGGDPGAIAYQLEYKLHADSVYIKAEPPGGGALASGTAGTTGTGGTTTCNVPYPATPAKGDILVAVVGNRPNANTPDDIANWTKVTSTGGAGSEGAGTGTIRNTIYYKEALGTESGNLAVACTSGTSMFGRMFKYSKTTGKKWAVAVAHGPDNAAGTGWSATAASDPGLAAGDYLICASVNSEDTARAASEAVTATGCTFGSMAELQDSGVTTGNDLSIVVADFPVSTGPSSAAPVYTMTMSGTNSANSAGSTAFVRIRQVDQPVQISVSGNIAAGGEDTTAQLTAPSGKSTSDFVTGRMWDDENGTDTIDITEDDYTEVEWCIKALSSGGAANADVYDLRVTKAGTALDTYTVSPEWTIGASDISADLGGSAVTMGLGTGAPGIAVPL